jgi:hypothetical protein
MLLTILIAFTTFAPRAQAKPGWWWNRVDNLQDPVEQESPNFFFCGGSAGPVNCAFDPSTWVVNPTPCAWDVDDHIDISGSATLPRKTTTTASFCTMSDGFDNYGGDDHSVEVLVGAPVDNFTVTLTSSRGFSTAASPTYEQGQWTYRICTFDRTPGPYDVIDGSNGGTGLRTDWTLSVTNPGQQQGKVGAILQTGFTGIYATGCPSW